MANSVIGTVQYDAIINTDKLNSGIDDAENKLKSSGKKALDMADKVSIATAAIIGGTLVASVKAFAEYEQMIGGVETLFKSSASTVEAYANNAYQTAGLSANQYMSTVTSFSASLLQGLGGDTKKAAEIGNMAVADMSDNANKMGSSMESIQNAYQGFARGEFVMLTNLKLGYGGTQAEMAKLINSTKIMGEGFVATADNVKDIPFDKMVLAINEVQTRMGITGTTAKEASGTISGSFAATKAAWENVLTAFGSGNKEMVQSSMDGLGESAKNLITNISAIVPNIIQGVADAVVKLGPVAVAISAIALAIGAVSTAFLVYTTIQKAAIIVQGIWNAILAVGTALQWLLNIALSANPIALVILAIIALIAIFVLLWVNVEGFRNFFINAWKIICDVAINSWKFIQDVFSGVGKWFIDVFSSAWTGIKNIFSAVGGFFSGVWNTITGIFGSIGTTIGNAIGGAFKGVVNSVLGFVEGFINAPIRAINTLIDAINAIPGIPDMGKLSTVKLPRMAMGGIVDEPTAAVIGEAGKEAVLPLENNTGWMDDLASKINGNGQTTIIVKIGEETIAARVIDLINDRTRLSGNNSILV